MDNSGTQQLQRVEGSESSEEENSQFLIFYLQNEMFGLNIQPIQEISEYGKVTSVPMVPDYVRGVVNLRGNVVPVIDLPARFGWQPSPTNKRTCIVIVEVNSDSGPLTVGIVIDRVSEVVEIPSGSIGAAPSFGAKVRTDFISGMGKVGEDFVILLNADKVLSVEELAELDSVASQHN